MSNDDDNSQYKYDSFEHRLDLAIKQDDLAVIQKLIADGLDVNREMTTTGWPLLMHAIDAEASDVAKEFISAGADVNLQDSSGETSLHFAAVANDIDMLQVLIDAGADINRQGAWGSTPLHRTDCGECQDLLVRNGADPAIKNEDGLSVDDLNEVRVKLSLFAGQSYSQAVGTMNIYLEADQRAAEQRDVLQQAIEESVPSRQSMTRRM